MPNLPKPHRRPWRPKQTAKAPHEGRKVKNPFYQTMPWRRFRAQLKEIALEQNRRLLLELAGQKKQIPPALMENQPLCAECLRGNVFGPIYRSAKVLDHIKPINPANAYDTQAGRYGEPLDPANVQWLCEMHHARKSGQEHKFHNQ